MALWILALFGEKCFGKKPVVGTTGLVLRIKGSRSTSKSQTAGSASPLPASCLFACFAIVYIPFMYPPDEGGGV
jgi:hypothetical protein